MVLISEVIMVVTTLATLCQSAPARRGTKARHSDGRQADPYLHDDTVEPEASIGSPNNLTMADHSPPGTSGLRDDSEAGRPASHPHPVRHRHHDERHHDSVGRRHRQHNRQPEHQNPNNRGRYEHLCETMMKTVHLNTDTEEYNPPFYVEVRCRQPEQSHSYSSVQKCAFNLLHCVQTYSTLNFSRRKADGSDCWQPYTLDVPSGCECMWPIEEFGPLNRREDL